MLNTSNSNVKRKHVKMTFYGQFQISMKFSAGKCLDYDPISWGPG